MNKQCHILLLLVLLATVQQLPEYSSPYQMKSPKSQCWWKKMMLKGIFSSLLVCQSSWTQLESGTCYLFRLIATKVPKLKKQKRFASNTLWIFSWQKTLWCTEKSISQLCTYTLSETASLFFSPCVSLLAPMTWLNHAVFQSLLNTVLPS